MCRSQPLHRELPADHARPPPRQAHVTLTSAQATLRLPGTAVYQVSSKVTQGYVHVGLPQASGAASAVTARISAGELELLPS